MGANNINPSGYNYLDIYIEHALHKFENTSSSAANIKIKIKTKSCKPMSLFVCPQ